MKALKIASEPTLEGKPRGRKKRNHLSRDMIVGEAAEMLKEGSVDALSLRGLAKRLGVGPMSLYTHFSNRDALLNGVADHVFALFEPPDIREPWQDYIHDWLWATYRLFERFPVAPDIINWDGRICPAWLKTWLPIAPLLRDQGLDGDRLAFALDWFSTAAMGFIQAQRGVPTTRLPSALAFVADLEPDEQRVAIELWSDFQGVKSREVLEFGFRQFVKGLETIVRNAKEARTSAQLPS